MVTSRALRRLLVFVLLLAVLVAGVGAAGALWLRGRWQASLPLLEGRIAVSGPGAPVRIERDARGRATIRARSREDLAFGLGFLHGQERFFQMDLSRRRAAGELAALVGPALVASDRAARRHRFREHARAALGTIAAPERRLLEAYAAGVNAGLGALGAPPPAYVVLRADPEAWRPEDSLLVMDAMSLLLQDDRCSFDLVRAAFDDLLGPEITALFAPAGTPWDAPIEGSPRPAPAIPGPEVLDFREDPPAATEDDPDVAPEAPAHGSNAFAVAGWRTAGGAALLANDMHLPLDVPATWFYASLVLEGGDGGATRRLAGVTLPGVPAVVAGSNGDIAWGLTNSYVDTCDVVLIEPDPEAPRRRYLTPDGPRPFETRHETIEVAGNAPVELEWTETIWGPVAGRDHAGRPYAVLWVADLPGAGIPVFGDLVEARTIEDAIAFAHRTTIPAQNLQVAARDGRIAWTIAGAVPWRIGFDGTRPVSMADGTKRWNGLLPGDEIPAIVDPPGGVIVTANARVVDGDALARLGDGGYALGARARQIRDGLLARDDVLDPDDLLAVQLDDRALFLRRWQELLLDLLGRHAGDDPLRQEMQRLVGTWGARAATDSAGYRIVRAFRDEVHRRVLAPFVARAEEAGASVSTRTLLQREAGVWLLVSARPPHLLDPRYADWDELLLAAADHVASELAARGRPLAERTWGERNTCRPRHPLSWALPGFLGELFDMPPRQLPGDAFMPRVQGPTFGASERLVVAPGAEDEGIFHMPCGQSGHLLSPFYRSEHDDWAAGTRVPFLPGPTAYRLVLEPGAGDAGR